MASSRPGKVVTSTGPRRRNASITSSTRTPGCPGRYAHGVYAFYPFGFKFPSVRNQIAGNSRFCPDLLKPVGIRAVLGAHHEDNVHQPGEFAHRELAVLCRIATPWP
jgi:hypothetical protein